MMLKHVELSEAVGAGNQAQPESVAAQGSGASTATAALSREGAGPRGTSRHQERPRPYTVRYRDSYLEQVFNGERPLVFDGAMGTCLQQAGLAPGEAPELFLLREPQAVEAVHRAYVAAGAQVATTCTFGASAYKLAGQATPAEVFAQAVAVARASGARYVAADIGPLGELMRPLGALDFDGAYQLFLEQAQAIAAFDVDLVLIETMSDVLEAKAAYLACRDTLDVPVVVSFTFDEHATTLMGATPQVVAATFAAMGADAVGVNCSQGPAALAALAARMKPLVDVPVLVQANAGLPHGEAGQATYDINASVYAAGVREILSAGATLVGGCCGTDPSYVQAFAPLVVAAPCGAAKESGEVEAVAAASAEKGGEVEAVAAASAEKPGEVDGAPAAFPARAVTGAPARDLVLTSPRQVVAAGPVAGPCVIGERLNPTGRKDLAAALVAGQFDAYIQEAQAQVAAGARVLDVNVGVPGLNEEAVLPQVVELLSTVVDAALCIDTGNAAALEVALKVYPGVALINSVNAKASSLAQVLPLAARYGACVLGLTLDEAGIPATASARQELAARMVTAAEGAGIARSRVAIDPLCMTVATNPAGVSDLLATIAWCRRELGVCTALGASNVSFGLPARPALNATFVAAALAAGLTLPIANVLDPALATTVAASRALLGYDQGFAGWIAFAQDHALEAPAAAQLAQGAQSAQPAQSAAGASNPAGFSAENASASGPASAAAATTPRERLYAGVLAGRKAEVDAAARELLDAGTPPLDLINAALIPALDEVGVRFQAGTLFLPQLLASAEAAQAGFAQVEKALPPQAATRPAVVVATVKGDVHDIGKNIVAMLLKNYGFDVVDLGKDVPAERIVEATRASGARLVGLSALMTTTLPAMEAAVAAVHAALPGVAVMVGGAVVTPEYAASISADFYAQDATESARIAQKVAGSK